MNKNQLLACAVALVVGFGLGWVSRTGGNSSAVAAKVNGHQILASDLGKELQDRFGADVLRDLVRQRVIAAEAGRLKIEVSEREVQARLDEWKKDPNQSALLQSGQVREQDVKRNLLTLMNWDRVTEKRIKEEDEKEFLLRHREELEGLELQDLVFEDEEKAKAESEHLKESQAWSKVPLKQVHRAQLNPIWAEVLFRLPEGELSSPLPDAKGFHIFRVGKRHFDYASLKGFIHEQLVAVKRNEVLEDLLYQAKIDVVPPFQMAGEHSEAAATPRPGTSGTPSVSAPSKSAAPAADVD